MRLARVAGPVVLATIVALSLASGLRAADAPALPGVKRFTLAASPIGLVGDVRPQQYLGVVGPRSAWLGSETGEAELEALFSQAGAIDTVRVMRDMSTGRARGFAFVEMSTEEEAQQAIARLNNAELGGRNLNVSEARERSQGPRTFGGPPRDFGGPPRGFGGDGPPRFRKDGGSRRGVRARKRSL